jgi:hypothetical protein
MKRTCILFVTMALLPAVAVWAQQPPLDEAALLADGWEQVETNFWQRPTETGGVLSLAYGEGKRFMAPQIQAEIDRVRASLEIAPSADKARALEALSGYLVELLSDNGTDETLKTAPPPAECQPWNFFHELLTWIVPTGSHGMVASAWGQWNGGGDLCPGSVYAAADYTLYPVGGSAITDSDWCSDSDSYAGACGVILWDPQAGPYTSCEVDAVVYLNLFHGTYSLSATESWSTCG